MKNENEQKHKYTYVWIYCKLEQKLTTKNDHRCDFFYYNLIQQHTFGFEFEQKVHSILYY